MKAKTFHEGERVLEHYDNDVIVTLSSYAGGANPLGSWGELTLAFHEDGKRRVRRYIAVEDNVEQVERVDGP